MVIGPPSLFSGARRTVKCRRSKLITFQNLKCILGPCRRRSFRCSSVVTGDWADYCNLSYQCEITARGIQYDPWIALAEKQS